MGVGPGGSPDGKSRDVRGMTHRLPKDWVPAVAERQYGLFTLAQAYADGATYGQARSRRESGRWVRVAGDAYARADLPRTPWVRAQAAGLTWPDAVVCFGSAARVHQLPVREDDAVHVIVPNRRAGRRGLISHRLALDPDDVVPCGLARVTSLNRTVFDCLGRLPDEDSRSLFAWTVTRDLFDGPALERALARRPNWWGNARRRQAVLDAADGVLSVAERLLHDLLHRAGIDGWAADQPLFAGSRLIARADILFHDVGLVLEVDGLAGHGPARFQSDRTRQNRIVAAGYTVLRFTWDDLTNRPQHVVRQVRELLAALRHHAPARFGQDLQL